MSAHHENNPDCICGISKVPNADETSGHRSAALVHLANIAARLGRVLRSAPRAEANIDDDKTAVLFGGRYGDGHWAVPGMS